jgi:hypothetical protein
MCGELFSHPSENVLYMVDDVQNEGSTAAQLDIHVGFEVDIVSYHMEKMRQHGESRQLEPSSRADEQRYYEFQLA